MNRKYRRLTGILAFIAAVAFSCTKTDEPSHSVGTKIPYVDGATQTISRMLDSLPNATFFDSAYRHAGMGAYLDSLRAGVSGSPYTLFVPTDDAFRAAGYTLSQIGQSSAAVLDSLLFYLATPGNYPYSNLDTFTGSVTINTLLTDPALQRSLPSPGFSTNSPYQYMLYMGLKNGTLWINGIPVRTAAQSLQATDGLIWLVDKVITRPVQETYQVLTGDTSYSYYMAALRYSDHIYSSGINYNLSSGFKDTLGFQVQPQYGHITVLAPTNDAFRRAGFNSVTDITHYIDGSLCISNYGQNLQGALIRTNMDSILDAHRVGYAVAFSTVSYPLFSGPGLFATDILYTNDLLYNPAVNNQLIIPGYGLTSTTNPPAYTGVSFQNNNGQVVVHRVDAPGGRAVHIISPHDITTLNGVVHRVDNLLLPTP